jgi:hypothetical protein
VWKRFFFFLLSNGCGNVFFFPRSSLVTVCPDLTSPLRDVSVSSLVVVTSNFTGFRECLAVKLLRSWIPLEIELGNSLILETVCVSLTEANNFHSIVLRLRPRLETQSHIHPTNSGLKSHALSLRFSCPQNHVNFTWIGEFCVCKVVLGPCKMKQGLQGGFEKVQPIFDSKTWCLTAV